MKSTAFDKIENLVLQDPGKRGFPRFAVPGMYRRAAESLFFASSVWMVSGFWILGAGALETDGPPGTVVLASALKQLKIPVRVFTDAHSVGIFHSASAALGLTDLPVDGADHFAFRSGEIAPSHFIALERPGKAVDGECYNFRGESVSRFTADTDALLNRVKSEGSVIVAVGDGGNELGMGNFRRQTERLFSDGRPFAAVAVSDFSLCAGVSNWGGYALAAMLSLLSGRPLMPTASTLSAVLKACAAAGCVDGVTGRNETTVDGLPPGYEEEVYVQIRRIADVSV